MIFGKQKRFCPNCGQDLFGIVESLKQQLEDYKQAYKDERDQRKLGL